ncbi:hypothetical protein XENOCAPTIV_005314 [Xenoophorus captivus]|uniref:Sodium/potassium-transporting ATPase subunit beta-3 n=1 Tax=Xenoophorus captivus TaxID=1517983 RepID=A0ABV0Q8W8_9TELE
MSLLGYNDTEQEGNEDCISGQYTLQEDEEGKDNLIQMHYFPKEGRFDKKYFPYYGKKAHENYVQPLVAVKLMLTKEDYNKELTVECKVEGSDLRNNDERDKFLGRVTFRIKVVE